MIYAKVLLYAFPKLRGVSEAVTAGIENKALLSFRSVSSAYAVAESLAEEILLRENLDGVTDAVEKVLQTFSEEESFLFEYRYFRRKRVLREQFGEYLPACSERQYYRLQECALKKFASRLCLAGWTEARFFQAFGSFSFFMKIYGALAAGKERSVYQKRARRELRFQVSSSGDCATGGFLPRRTMKATTTAAAQTMQTTAICMPVSPPFPFLSAGGTSPDEGVK